MSDKLKQYKLYKLSTGLTLRAFDGWSQDDIKLNTSEASNAKFLKNHAVIFNDSKIISSKENMELEQEVLNSTMALLEMAHDSMSTTDYKKFAELLKVNRQTYAKKFSVLFKYIKKLHKETNIVDSLVDE
jgi:hypothetical protein